MSSLPMGHPFKVAIRHQEGVRVTFVLRGMEPLEPRPKRPGLTHVRANMSAGPSLGRESKWLIGLEYDGDAARITQRFQPAHHGGAILRGDTWEILDPQNSLDAEDARQSPIRVAPPPTWGGREVCEEQQKWAVMEGEHLVGEPGSRPQKIQELFGLGAALTVRLGPYNAIPAIPPDGGPKRLDALILADRVVDRGIVRGVPHGEATDDAHAWRIELTHEVEIDEHHEVLWWDRSGEVHHLRPTAWSIGGSVRHDLWSVEPPHVDTQPRALIFTFNDRRLGAWWTTDWAFEIVDAAAREPVLIADLIRWAKLPVLEERSLPEVRRLAEAWPVEVLMSWLSDQAPDGWRFVIRAAFRNWWPRAVSRSKVSPMLWGSSAEFPEVATARRLMEICPILMGRYLRAMGAGVPARRHTRVLYRMIGERVEEKLRSVVCDYVGTEETVHDGIERRTELAPKFLKALSATGVAAVLCLPADGEFDQRSNLELAVTRFTACRLLLTLDILESLEAGRLSYWKGGPCGTARRPEADRFAAPQARRLRGR